MKVRQVRDIILEAEKFSEGMTRLLDVNVSGERVKDKISGRIHYELLSDSGEFVGAIAVGRWLAVGVDMFGGRRYEIFHEEDLFNLCEVVAE